MPITQAFFQRSNALLLALGTAVLLVIVAVSLWLTSSTDYYFGRLSEARAVRSATADLLSLVQDAETGQRGFLLTHDESYLQPYLAAVDNLPRQRKRLEDAVANLRETAPDVQRLFDRVDRKMAELSATVAAARAGDVEGALARVKGGAGKQLMDEVRADLAAILAKSESSLRDAMDSQRTASERLRWTTILGALAILALAAGASWTIIGYTREIIAARTEVEALNLGLEERVRQRTEALVKANEEVQRFAYIVTHDLRAPLVNIMGFTSELEAMFKPIDAYVSAGDAATPQQKAEAEEALRVEVPEAIGFIRSSTRKMDGLVNAILKISREGRRVQRAEGIDLTALIQGAAAAVHHQASGEADEGIVVDSQVGRIVSDRLSLDQIMGNLLDNAIKYRSPERPLRITVRTRRERGGRVAIEIADNGRGIAAGDHERIFELFRRSGVQDTAGEGIGLAHVRTLVRNLGGDIAVRSELGKGTAFTVVLPSDLAAYQRSTHA